MIIIFLEFAAQLKYTRAKAKIASGQGFFLKLEFSFQFPIFLPNEQEKMAIFGNEKNLPPL